MVTPLYVFMQVLFSTETFAMGVNAPARTVSLGGYFNRFDTCMFNVCFNCWYFVTTNPILLARNQRINVTPFNSIQVFQIGFLLCSCNLALPELKIKYLSIKHAVVVTQASYTKFIVGFFSLMLIIHACSKFHLSAPTTRHYTVLLWHLYAL